MRNALKQRSLRRLLKKRAGRFQLSWESPPQGVSENKNTEDRLAFGVA